MPEYLFEPSQADDSNTVAFNSYGASECFFNDLGLPQEFALIFDNIVPNTKPVSHTPVPQLYLPMNLNQFDSRSQSTPTNEQHNISGCHGHALDTTPTFSHALEPRHNFGFDLHLQNHHCQSQNVDGEDFSFSCLPELESVFSDSGFNSPNLQCNTLSVNDPFEGLTSSFTSRPAIKQQMKKPHKIIDTNTKKHKRRHIMARSRTGCWICRIKHLKCDELRPSCNNCVRFGIQCDFSESRPDYVLDINLRREKLNSITTKKRRKIVE